MCATRAPVRGTIPGTCPHCEFSAPTMAHRPAALSPRPAAWLTLVGLLLEVLAWVWAYQVQSGITPLIIGCIGIVLWAVAMVMLLLSNQATQSQLRHRSLEAKRAVEHNQSMEKALLYANRTRELLISALDALPIGIAIYDQQDRQVIRNRCLGEMFPGLFKEGSTGESLESVLRRVLDMGLLAQPVDDPQAWVLQRLQSPDEHGDGQPTLEAYAHDRWIHTYQVSTRQGYRVVAVVDVTDLIRKENLLAQANELLSRKSATDGLTGIANRRKFDDMLVSEWQRAARSGGSLSLLMVDIDHFKRFNDQYGHLAGDECLRQVSQVLANCVRRAGELLARYGGEEFVLLLPGANLAHAQEMAQRCLHRITRKQLPHVASPTAAHVTFSIGVAHVMPSVAERPETLVNAADTAMYRAKMAGRACYAVANLADWKIDKDASRSRPAALE